MKEVTRQMSVRRRGRRKPAASQTKHYKRGALAQLKGVLSDEQYRTLERAVNRKKRGLPPEKPQPVDELEDGEQLEDELEDELEDGEQLEDPPLMETSTPERWCERCAKHRPSPKCGVCGGPTLEAKP